jgi:hypothetical protein
VGVVILSGVAGPEVEKAVPGVAEPVVDVVAVVVVLPEVLFVVDLEVSEPGVVFVAVSIAHVVEPQTFGDIAVAIVLLVPVSVVRVEVDSSGRPTKFLAFPSVDYFASSSSSVEVVDKESVHSSTDARTNYDLCSVLSNLGLRQNKISEHCHNKPNPGYNNVSDTNDLPKDATTSHPRKRCHHQCQVQHRHTYQV